MRYGQFLRSKRVSDSRELTLKDVAEELGVSVSFVSDVEQGRRKPYDEPKTQKLIAFLHLSEEDVALMYDLAARENSRIPRDLDDIMMYGDIYIDCLPGVMKLSCSKGNLSKTFTKTVSKIPDKWSSYKVSLTTKVKPEQVTAGMLLVIEPEDYSKAEIAALKAKGAIILGYLSAGAVSDERTYYKELKPYTLDTLEDWPHERYLDLRRSAVRDWCVRRAKEIKEQRCDGWWIDNLDVCEVYRSSAMYEAVSSVLTKIKALGGYVMVNGGTEYLQKAMDADGSHKGLGSVDGVTQEEVFSRITSYKSPGTFGAQEAGQSAEYQSHISRCIRHKLQAFLLEYTKDNVLKLRIKAFCTEKGTAGCCISGDVSL